MDAKTVDAKTVDAKSGDSKSGAARAPRKPRADSLRNRERLLTAAREIFAAGGPDASLEAVARRAGVGIGTLYRHFPTRETLFLAVYRREAEELSALAASLAQANDPVEALRRWLRAAVGMVATKKGMVAVLSPALDTSEPLFAEVRVMLLDAVDALVGRAVEAGAMRADVPPADVMRALFGFCYTIDAEDWQPAVLRLLDVFVDGLRPQPAAE
ncbi:helix-turn-helix domain containing protein [Albimonas sp. CAU 1670]|uniref:TetR/AcrR family transcriptional regulator n=1 Tax=Albimonas sp. CAU 1670 TaxID=3032599 RepID=UPI0023DA4A0E|nr:TetR/AcrR family transcriptional regulator [Albimonas sp. CAU 1670]MDF2233749.1 helix-turn-helix domain containing protein [Albimonas sp. CAU 1670]